TGVVVGMAYAWEKVGCGRVPIGYSPRDFLPCQKKGSLSRSCGCFGGDDLINSLGGHYRNIRRHPMQCPVVLRPRATNIPLIVTMWAMTLFAWGAPYLWAFPMGLCSLFCLASNVMALFLIFSRSRADILHGGLRLILQLVVFLLIVVMVLTSGDIRQVLL